MGIAPVLGTANGSLEHRDLLAKSNIFQSDFVHNRRGSKESREKGRGSPST
jgi:hypothetical protein